MPDKYIEEELDDSQFAVVKGETDLVATLKRLILAINSDASNDNRLAEVVGKNNAAIGAFMQVIKGLRFDIPEMNPNINLPAPIVNVNQDVVVAAINNATEKINERQDKTNELLQTVINSRVSEWEFSRVDSNFMGGIQKATAKATKYYNQD